MTVAVPRTVGLMRRRWPQTNYQVGRTELERLAAAYEPWPFAEVLAQFP